MEGRSETAEQLGWRDGRAAWMSVDNLLREQRRAWECFIVCFGREEYGHAFFFSLLWSGFPYL